MYKAGEMFTTLSTDVYDNIIIFKYYRKKKKYTHTSFSAAYVEIEFFIDYIKTVCVTRIVN